MRVGERGGEEREVEKEGEEGEEEESVEVTDIDEYAPSCLMKRTVLIPGVLTTLRLSLVLTDDMGYPAVCPDFYVPLVLMHFWAALNLLF